jgi:methyl-accepting chemotaxis protein
MRRIIGSISEVMTRLSAGDLTAELDEQFEGEFQVLGDAINQFVSEMSGTIGSIYQAVETINTASSEIATGNADLSSRTEQQASSLEETASSMEELTGTVKLNAENAEQANSLASQSCEIASRGGELIRQVVDTMSSINESAQEISDIIGVIDGIAFQTNILALNAAVEAARAGEQGRGFAVVASEVRSLAQRSAEAAKEIKELISDSVSKIDGGNKLVNQSGDTMEEVVTSIKRVNDIMSEIAAASSEQASGIEEVSKAVVQMDEMTQQNAALVEEAAAAAESLQQQAGSLSERVSAFNIGDKAAVNEVQRTNVAPSNKNKHVAPVTAIKTQKKLAPKVPNSDDWESF